MKLRVVVFLLLVCTQYICISRSVILLGAKGGYANTWVLNKNVKSDPEIKLDFSFAPHYGITYRYNYKSWEYNTKHLGYTFEFLFAQYQQKYLPEFLDDNWERQLDIFTFDVPAFYRFTMDYAVNLEAGLIFSYHRIVTGDFPFDSDFTKGGYTGYDLTEKFSKINMAAAARISTDIKITKNIAFNPGLFYSYGFWDIISKKGGKGEIYKDTKDGFYKPTHTMQIGGWGGLIIRF